MPVSTLVVSNAIIGDLAYDVLTEVAADEKLIFEENCEAYFANPTKALAEEQQKDQMLGFGTEVVVFLTPFVLAIVTEVVKFLAEELKKAIGAEIGEAIKLLFKKHRPQAARQAPPPLTAEQLAQVREVAYKKGRELKLSDKQANHIADALVGGLVKAT